MHEPLPTCESRFARIESALEDNGAWGIKTKVAQLWDWFIVRKSKDIIIDQIDNKIDKTECDVKHEKLMNEIKDMIEKKDKNWRWWFEQMKWLLPMGWAFSMWLISIGVIRVEDMK